jgi:hypothetical protein
MARILGDLNLDGDTLKLKQGGDSTSVVAGSPASDITLTLPTITDTLVGRATADTLTNKTLTAPDINGGTADSLTSLSVRDTSAAFDVTIAAVSSVALDAGRTLTLNVQNAARAVSLAGDITLAGDFATSGGHAVTLASSATTNVTLPTTGTLSTLAGTETLTNKTISGATNTISNIDVGTAVADNSIAYTKLVDATALSVLGRSADSSGAMAAISAGTDHFVLRRSGNSLGFGLLVDANIDAAAAIAQSKLNLSITNSEINASAAIAYSKLALTGSIVDADINSSAAIAYSKLASLPSAQILVGSSGNVPTATDVTGDVTISNTGVTAISSGVIVDADINASAAIAQSKLNLSITNAEVNAAAAIDGSKIVAASATVPGVVTTGTQTFAGAKTFSSVITGDISGNAGTVTDGVYLSGAQTITGVKTFDEELVLKEQATPTTPASTYYKIYPKSDGKLYKLNPAGEEIEIGSGSGAGLKNYVDNPNFDTNIADWSTDDATNFTIAAETVAPLAGTASLKITRVGAGTNVVTGTIAAIDEADVGTLIAAEAVVKVTGAAISTGDYTIEIHDGTNPVPGTVTDLQEGKHRYTFDFIPQTGVTYTIKIRDDAGADDDVLLVDEVRVGPNPAIIGGAGGWKIYTESVVTITNVLGSVALGSGEFIPYKDPLTGNWRLKGNAYLNHTTSITTYAFRINGIKVGDVRGTADRWHAGSDSPTNTASKGLYIYEDSHSTLPNQFRMFSTSTLDAERSISFDIPLKEKPTWADFDGTVAMLTPSVLGENAKLSLHSPTATSSGTSAGANTDLNFATVVKNTGFTYNPSTGVGTILADGDYEFSINLPVLAGQVNRTARVFIRINDTTNHTLTTSELVTTTGNTVLSGNRILFLNAGNTFVFRYNNVSSFSSASTWAGTEQSHAYVTRIADRSSRGALGFGLATSEAAGLVVAPTITGVHRSGTSQTGLTSNTIVKVQFNTLDSGSNSFFNTTDHEFKPTIPGHYLVRWSLRLDHPTANNIRQAESFLYKNGSHHIFSGSGLRNSAADIAREVITTGSAIVFMNGSSDYLDVRARIVTSAGSWDIVQSSANTNFSAIKIG